MLNRLYLKAPALMLFVLLCTEPIAETIKPVHRMMIDVNRDVQPRNSLTITNPPFKYLSPKRKVSSHRWKV